MSITYILSSPAYSNSTGSHLGPPIWSGSLTTPPVISAGPITAIVNSGAPHQSAVNQGSVFSLSTPTAAPTAPVQQGALSFAKHLQGEESPCITAIVAIEQGLKFYGIFNTVLTVYRTPVELQKTLRSNTASGPLRSRVKVGGTVKQTVFILYTSCITYVLSDTSWSQLSKVIL